MNEQKSYRHIVKATSLLGSVQAVTIIIGIIKTKFVAVLLGTTGMGMLGLYNTTLALIQTVTGLGLSSSAVREIAEANGSNDARRISRTIKMFRRWVWVTGLLGTIFTLSLAPMLSKWTFGSQKYTWSFICLSIICLLSAINSGQNVLLQGMRQLKLMAKSTVFGSILGLFTSVPLYYLYGLRGVVPAIIIAALSSVMLSWYFARQIHVESIKQTWKETYYSGLNMAKFGFIMMLSSFMVTAVSYTVTLFISNKGGISEVGLYRAGWTIAIQYTGLVFSAMGTDYYPRLAAISKDNDKMKILVNQQAEMSIIILTPLLVALIGFVPIVVQLFYTKEFMPIAAMIKWCMVGMLCKALSWVFAFSIMAKGDKKMFFITETVGNIITLLFNIIGYYFRGIEGVGIAFLTAYLIYGVIILVVTKKQYNITPNSSVIKLLNFGLLTTGAAFFVSFLLKEGVLQYSVAIIFVGMSILFSLRELNKRLDLKKVVMQKIVR